MSEQIQRWHTVLNPKPDTVFDNIFTRTLFVTDFALGQKEDQPTLAILTAPSFHHDGVSTGIFSYYVPADDLEKLFDISDKSLQDMQADFWNSTVELPVTHMDLEDDELLEFKAALEEDHQISIHGIQHIHVYENAFDLYREHFLADASKEDLIETIRLYTEGADMEDNILDDADVFTVGDHWVYCSEYTDLRGESAQ